MTTQDFITELFCRVDDVMPHDHQVPKHSQANLYPSELVTLGLLYALKGKGQRAFYRWMERDCKLLFPKLPERTRLFRALAAHQEWTRLFLESATTLGICDSYGIELIHPMREGRTSGQLGKKGKSNHRWIVGAKVCLVLNQWGLITDWDADTANVSDQVFQALIAQYQEQMIVFTDTGFHAKEGDPAHMKVCPRGTWNDRMRIEGVFSMLHRVCSLKHMTHRVWKHLKAHLAFALAIFNICVQWDGFPIDENGVVHLSFAKFSL
ncbi:MAG TPA: hypothetical protein VNA16_01275 [Abditibacteriaceae bacterium]|nr:hypothetical protein [Abditibacteriaceae bacterium]